MGKHFIDPKRSEILSIFQFFLVRCKLPFFGQNCSLPFSLRSLDIPALLKSWQKHYEYLIHCAINYFWACPKLNMEFKNGTFLWTVGCVQNIWVQVVRFNTFGLFACTCTMYCDYSIMTYWCMRSARTQILPTSQTQKNLNWSFCMDLTKRNMELTTCVYQWF
jgi:hypothetical protein